MNPIDGSIGKLLGQRSPFGMDGACLVIQGQAWRFAANERQPQQRIILLRVDVVM